MRKTTVFLLSAIILTTVKTSTIFAHCKWNHPHHCVADVVVTVVETTVEITEEVIEGTGDVLVEVVDVGEELIEGTGDVLGDVVDVGEELIEGTGGVLGDVGDVTLGVIDDIGEGFSELMCDLVGKEPGVDCHVSGGVNTDLNGNVAATDGQGNIAEKPEFSENDDTDALAWQEEIMLEEWSEQEVDIDRYVIGGLVMFSPEPPQGVSWFTTLPSTPTSTGLLRNDQGGYALVGARRKSKTGTYYLHRGTDYLNRAGAQVLAPISGEVISVSRMSNKPFNFIEIKNASGVTARIFYVNPTVTKGSNVTQKFLIGTSQNLHVEGGYPASVSNHVHVEYRTQEGHSLSPNGRYAVLKDTEGVETLCKTAQCFAPEKY